MVEIVVEIVDEIVFEIVGVMKIGMVIVVVER